MRYETPGQSLDYEDFLDYVERKAPANPTQTGTEVQISEDKLSKFMSSITFSSKKRPPQLRTCTASFMVSPQPVCTVLPPPEQVTDLNKLLSVSLSGDYTMKPTPHIGKTPVVFGCPNKVSKSITHPSRPINSPILYFSPKIQPRYRLPKAKKLPIQVFLENEVHTGVECPLKTISKTNWVTKSSKRKVETEPTESQSPSTKGAVNLASSSVVMRRSSMSIQVAPYKSYQRKHSLATPVVKQIEYLGGELRQQDNCGKRPPFKGVTNRLRTLQRFRNSWAYRKGSRI